LVAQWGLNRLDGDIVPDLGPNGLNAIAESVALVDGRGGKVMAFDGVQSKIQLPDEKAFEVKGDYSVSFCVRVPVDSEKIGPIYTQPSFNIYFFKGNLRVTLMNPAYGTTGQGDLMGPKINDGEWHHVVFSYTGNTGEAFLFLDGQLVETVTFTHPPEVSFPTTVGASGRGRFEGELSDLRVYSRVLDQVDATALGDAPLLP
jgi:hypothetical protein